MNRGLISLARRQSRQCSQKHLQSASNAFVCRGRVENGLPSALPHFTLASFARQMYSINLKAIDKSFIKNLQDNQFSGLDYSPEREETLYFLLSRNLRLFEMIPTLRDLVEKDWSGKCSNYYNIFSPFIALAKTQESSHVVLDKTPKIPSDNGTFMSQIKKAAEEGNSLAKAIIADDQWKRGENIDESRKILKELSDTGLSFAQFTYGLRMLEEGKIDEGYESITNAASGEYPLPAAQTYIGNTIIESGENIQQGLSFLREAAANGFPYADISLIIHENLNFLVREIVVNEKKEENPNFGAISDYQKDILASGERLSEYAGMGYAEAIHAIGKLSLPSYDIDRSIALFQKAGEMGCGASFFELSKIFTKGLGFPSNLEKAFGYLQEGMKLGSEECEAEYGYRLATGKGCEMNEEEGKRIIDKLVKRHSPSGLYSSYLLKIKENPNDRRAYLEPLMNAAKLGHAKALFQFALDCLHYQNDVDSVPSLLYRAADLGCGEACFYVASTIAAEDQELQVKYLSQGSSCLHLASMSTLGHVLMKGGGSDKSIYDAGKGMLMKAIDLGDSLGCSHLGYMYYTGVGIEKDIVSAVKYLKESVRRNPTAEEAHGLLAQIYSEGGKGVPRNLKQAFIHLQKLAEISGNPEALFQTGERAFHGIGIDSDPEGGLAYIKKAAEKNYKPALKFLSEVYETGANGIKKNETEAKKYKELFEKE